MKRSLVTGGKKVTDDTDEVDGERRIEGRIDEMNEHGGPLKTREVR
jgi:hypothetical protein